MSAKFPTAKLTAIAELNPTLDKKLPAEELVSFVPMASLSAESASVETTQDRPYAEVAKGFTPFLDSDVLVAKITPCFENGKIAQARLPRPHGFGSTEFHVVRARSGVAESRYLHHYLRLEEVRANGQRRMTGSGGQRRVPASFLADLAIPLPPLEEQRRIAAILDQAETLRTQRRTALALLDSLTQSLFLDMFGDPVTNSKGWPISNIGREAKLQGGFAFKSNDYAVNGVRLVKISNVHRDALTWDDLDYLPESYIEVYKSFNLNIGDIVLALTRPIIQSLDSVKIAVVSAIDVPSLLNQRVGRFVITQPTRLEPQYLLGFCRSKAFFNAVTKFCSESLQPNMSTAQVEGLELPLPPLPLQQTFATRIASIEALKATHRRALAALDALFASLQQRAFAGQL